MLTVTKKTIDSVWLNSNLDLLFRKIFFCVALVKTTDTQYTQ